ncbi:acyl-CoA dehydrogenase [Sphingobium xenophagum]|uniref:Acyl-CoA dehydrogenase n=1 Tax=Sphingobium xenophagum TaxID=121428 RepID=A0ABU1WXN7_SPHXE|nr:acyl-CoA dehydrogenase family protein [Sphingobium xenophagum]MDR7154045.1 acyl-CoA dehydrogenase [Sphingobium xenophagum]
MNFGFNEEQKSLGETVAALLADFPALTGPDPAEARDSAVWQALADLGLFALLVPEGHGGVGLALVDVALAIEALGAGLAPPIAASTLIATDIIVREGTAVQQASLLPRIATGELRIALAVLENGQSYDPDAVQTVMGGNGVTGSKILVPDADIADLLMVLARVDGGVGLVLVARDARGVSIRHHADIDPSSGLCEVTLDGAALMEGALVGHAGSGDVVPRLMDAAAIVYAGMAMGMAARMLDASVNYAKTRVQFGQPIGAFQSIKHRCADMAVAVEAGRSAAYYAFWTAAENDPDRSRAASMAKAYCGEVARDVCNETVQIHGGMGFTWELGLHRFLRRAKVLEHGFGNHVWHYERIMAETLAAQAAGGKAQVA